MLIQCITFQNNSPHVWFWVIFHAFVVVCRPFPKLTLKKKNLSGILSDCRTVWIQIRTDVLSVLIWIKTACKGFSRRQKLSLARKELKSLTIVEWLKKFRERSGSVVECLTRDRGAAGLSLTGITTLCPWARHFNPSLVLVQPRKTSPFITERLLMGRKESNQTNNKQEISLKKIFGGSQILTINATKFAGLDEGATPLGPYSATRGFTW